MELIKYKRMKNIPGYFEGKLLTAPKNAEQVGGAITGGIGFAGSIFNAFGPVKSSSDMEMEAGTSTSQGPGFSYNTQNTVNTAQQMDDLSKENTANTIGAIGAGAKLGASFGPIGAAAGAVVGGIAGLIGGAHRKKVLARRILATNQQIRKDNSFNFASGQTDYLGQQYYADNNSSYGDQIFSARHGKKLMHRI